MNTEGCDDNRPRSGDVRGFLDRLYLILGTFCLGWSASAVVGILRKQPLDLPILGKADVTEIIIFTLLGFSLLMPLLLCVIATWRGVAAKREWRARYPGAPTDEWEIPKSFAWLRGLLFVLLVFGPLSTMQLCYQRMLGLEIHWIGHGEAVELKQEGSTPGRTLFDFPPKPDPKMDYANWRWFGPVVENGNDPSAEKNRSKITAFPGFMPWTFRLISYGGISVALWFLFAPPGMLRLRLLKRRG